MMTLSTLNILSDWGSYWLPPQGSTIAPQVDWLFDFVMGICIFFFLLILVLLVFFAIKYRYREGAPMLDAPKHNTALELTWTFVPTVIVVVIFYYGFVGFVKMAVIPENSYQVVVSAHMWSYVFRYPNGHIDDKLHIPANMPVEIVLTSEDVIHGFFIPDFRVKKDDVPGRYNKIWVNANVLGEHDIFCTQYCGDGHSTMRSHVVVQNLDDFNNWLANADHFDNPVDAGKHLWETRGCNQCHSTDGSANRCPTWKDVYGSTVTFKDGTSQFADENYLHMMITEPNTHLIPGFDPIMPPTSGMLTETDVTNLIAFIKTLSVHYHPTPVATTAPAATAPKQ